MEIFTWKKNKNNKEPGFMIRVNKDQAMKIILSLSSQLVNNNPNTGRIEFITKKGEYFSITITD